MVIGLTGGIGSGKSTVLELFSKFNVATYIADKEAKTLMNSSEEIKTQLKREFGEEVYVNEQLNRAFLADIVFNNKQKLSVLNSIVHPEVHKHLQDFIAKNKHKDYIIYENAILFENGSDKLCDKIITVTAPKTVRLQRVIKRDNTTKEAVESRMKNQWPEEKKIIQSNYVIVNTLLEQTKLKVLKIHNNLTNNRV